MDGHFVHIFLYIMTSGTSQLVRWDLLHGDLRNVALNWSVLARVSHLNVENEVGRQAKDPSRLVVVRWTNCGLVLEYNRGNVNGIRVKFGRRGD